MFNLLKVGGKKKLKLTKYITYILRFWCYFCFSSLVAIIDKGIHYNCVVNFLILINITFKWKA